MGFSFANSGRVLYKMERRYFVRMARTGAALLAKVKDGGTFAFAQNKTEGHRLRTKYASIIRAMQPRATLTKCRRGK